MTHARLSTLSTTQMIGHEVATASDVAHLADELNRLDQSAHGTLHRYSDGEIIGPATAAERELSDDAAESDGGVGVIVVDMVSCYVID